MTDEGTMPAQPAGDVYPFAQGSAPASDPLYADFNYYLAANLNRAGAGKQHLESGHHKNNFPVHFSNA